MIFHRHWHAGAVAVGLSVAALAPALGAEDALPHYDHVLLCADVSGSLDPREYDVTIATIAGVLPDLLSAMDAPEVGLLPWAGSLDAWRSVQSIAIPPPPGAPHRELVLGEAERLFRGARDRAEARVRAQEEADSAAAQATYRRSVLESLRPLLEDLRRCRSGSASCTAFQDVLARSGSEAPRTLAIILTDGREEPCSPVPPPPLVRPHDGTDIVVILVPSAGDRDAAGTILQARVSAIRRAAPWVRVVPSFRVRARGLAWLSAALGNHTPLPTGASREEGGR